MSQIRPAINLILSLAIGTLLVCSGLFAFVVGRQTLLICERPSSPSGHCRFTKTSWLLKETKTFSLETIENVEVETKVGSSPSKVFYRSIIHTPEHTITLEWTLGPSDVEKLDAFLQDPSQTDLVIETDTRGITHLFGWVFLVPGIVLLIPVAWKLLSSKSTIAREA